MAWRMGREPVDGGMFHSSPNTSPFLSPRLGHSAGGRGLCRHHLLGRRHPVRRDQVPDADGGAEAESLRGAAGLHSEQCPAGRTGGLLPGAHHQQCPCLSSQRHHLP